MHGPEVRSGAVHVALSTSPSFGADLSRATVSTDIADATGESLPMSAEVTFWGSSLVIFDGPSTERGTLWVYADDLLLASIDLATTEPPTLAFFHEWDEPGQHRVQLVLSPSIAGEVANLDALLIHF